MISLGTHNRLGEGLRDGPLWPTIGHAQKAFQMMATPNNEGLVEAIFVGEAR